VTGFLFNKLYFIKDLFFYFLLLSSPFFASALQAQDNQWKIVLGTEIVPAFDGTTAQAYSDTIEMAGKRLARIISYEIDSLRKAIGRARSVFSTASPIHKGNRPRLVYIPLLF